MQLVRDAICPSCAWSYFIMSFLNRAGQSGLYHHFLWPLSVVQGLPLLSFTFSLSLSLSEHVALPHVSLSPSVHVSLPLLMFLLSLFPPPLKCRNPSTAFYQAFRPSRLRGSKPVNDRYELGCVYTCVCMCVRVMDWLTKPGPTPLKPCALCKMSILTSLFSYLWTVINKVRHCRQFPEESDLFWIF